MPGNGGASGPSWRRFEGFRLAKSAARRPQPGAPYTYVTTKKFLSHFGFDTLRDLPDMEQLEGGRVAQQTEAVRRRVPRGPKR